MKTQITELDKIYKFEKGDSTLLLGNNDFALNSLFYTMINNLAKNGKKVLLIEKLSFNSFEMINKISKHINSQNDLILENYNLTIISLPKAQTRLKKFLEKIKLKQWDYVFLKLRSKHFNSGMFSFINNLCSDFNISIISFPQYPKTTSLNNYQNLIEQSAYTITINQQSPSNLILAKITFPAFEQEPIITTKIIQLKIKDNIAIT